MIFFCFGSNSLLLWDCACSCLLGCSVVSRVSVVCYSWIGQSVGVFQDSKDIPSYQLQMASLHIDYIKTSSMMCLAACHVSKERRDHRPPRDALMTFSRTRNAAPFLFQWQHMKSHFRSVNHWAKVLVEKRCGMIRNFQVCATCQRLGHPLCGLRRFSRISPPWPFWIYEQPIMPFFNDTLHRGTGSPWGLPG